MSRATWEREFYPCDAKDAAGSDKEAIEHSLQKWRGMRSKGVKRHGRIESTVRIRFQCSDTCALCVRHYRSAYSPDPCKGCPLYESGDGCVDDGITPYDHAVCGANPEPLIEALEVALINVTEAGE